MAISENSEILAKDITAALDEKIDKVSSLTLGEIQTTTDLTGKVAGASVIKDGVLTTKSVSTARYIQFGKLVVADFASTITGDISTGLPNPHQFLVVTLRDNTDGNFSTFYMDSGAVLKVYKATNYVSGHTYSGIFVYLTD